MLQISTLPATEKAADHYQIYEILGRSDVEVTLNVYDHPETENFRGTSGGSSRSVVTRCYEIGIGGAVNYCKQTKMEPTTRVELVTCRLRNSSAPRKLLKDLGCISTLWGIENRCGRKMCNTLCNGRLDYIARQRVRNFGLQVFRERAVKRLLLFAIIIGTLLLAPMVAQADTVTFTGGAGTTDWNTKANWSPARVPTESDDVTIPSGQTVPNEPFASLGTGFINSLTLLGTLTIDTAGLSLQSPMAPSTINNLILTSTSTYSVLTMQGPTTFTGYLALSPGPNRRSMLVTYQHRFCLGRCSQTNRG